jgi:hypothetical protein
MPVSAMEAEGTKWDIAYRGEQAMTITITPRPPIATTPHVYSLPVVRELPPVARPGTYASTW